MATKEELIARLAECVLEMEDEEVVDVANEYIEAGYEAYDGIMEGLVASMNKASDLYDAAFLHGDGHAVLHIAQELLAQAVDDRHLAALQPYVLQDGSGRRQRVDRLGKEHAGRLTVHGAGAVEHQPARGGTDGARQAKRLPGHGLAVEIRIVLVAAGRLLVAELQRLLEGCQRVQPAMTDQRRRADGALRDHPSCELPHARSPPFVICVRISSSV